MLEQKPVDVHPFERTLGPGPYRFVGMFSINLEAGRQGRPYVDKSLMHPRFKEGCGTCAHCGQAILNVCQIQVGNGDVYGVGTDCVMKTGLPVRELTAIQKAERARQKAMRDARLKAKGDKAREELRQLAGSGQLGSLPHPSPYQANKGATLADYAAYIAERSTHNGCVIGLGKVKYLMTNPESTKACRICGGNDAECLDSSGAHSICVVRERKGQPTPALNVPVLTDEQAEAFKIQQARELGIFNDLGSRMNRR